MNDAPGTDRDPLEEAQQTIARQAAEIQRLRRDLVDQDLVHGLRQAVQVAATAGTIAAPSSHARLVELVVDVAMRVIRANAASLFLLDEATQELVLEFPFGPKAPEIKRLRLPLGHGIAGLVAVNGQPMAVSDARSDPRHAVDIADRVGYAPQSILCVPLVHNDAVIGVLELFDKEGMPGFTSEDMDTLSLFAEQAAIAIEQARSYEHLATFIGQILESLNVPSAEVSHELSEPIHTLATDVEAGASYQRALEIARLVQQIGQSGVEELQVCQVMLQGFADYLRRRPALGVATWGRP